MSSGTSLGRSLKVFAIHAGLSFAAAYAVGFFAADEWSGIVVFGTFALMAASPHLYVFLLELKDLAGCLFGLVLLPLRLVGIKRDVPGVFEARNNGRGLLPVFLLLFGAAGLLFAYLMDQYVWLLGYLLLGLAWGLFIRWEIRIGYFDLQDERETSE